MSNQLETFVVYCSPAGTTRHVAEVIGKRSAEMGDDVHLFDLGKKGDEAAAISEIRKTENHFCLFIGSPVYVSHAVPPVMRFISKLPSNTSASAIPFVTWGGATSGIALYEMGKALQEKGMNLLGGAKVLALHSMLWRTENPLGAGHPNTEDDQMIREMVAKIHEKLSGGVSEPIPVSALAYYPENVRAEMEKRTLELVKPHMPQRKVDETLCSQCDQCADVCPTESISFSPYPEFGSNCIFCLNCVKVCPEDAIKIDLAPMESLIRERAKQFSERPFTQIFI